MSLFVLVRNSWKIVEYIALPWMRKKFVSFYRYNHTHNHMKIIWMLFGEQIAGCKRQVCSMTLVNMKRKRVYFPSYIFNSVIIKYSNCCYSCLTIGATFNFILKFDNNNSLRIRKYSLLGTWN